MATANRNVSGVTLNDFFAAVLKGLGAPVTANNLAKLGAVAAAEGHGGNYNPFNYVVGPGTNFNSVGVKNYPDVQTGIAQTIKLLSQRNTGLMRANLMADDKTWSNWTANVSNFYRSWGGGPLTISPQTAQAKLNQQLDGPAVTNWSSVGGAAAGGAAAAATPFTPVPIPDKTTDTGWQQAHQSAFQSWLYTQPLATQQGVVNWFQSDQPLSEVGRYLNDPSTSPQAKDYIQNYLAYLPKDLQRSQATSLGVDPNPSPTAPGPSPEFSATLKSTLGLDYPNAPQPTPALLAFVNGLGLQMQSAQALRDKAIQRVQQAMTDSLSEIDTTADRTKQNITADLIRRGVLTSGESNTRYANQAQDVGRQKSAVTNTEVAGETTAQDTYNAAADAARQAALDKLVGAETDQATAAATAKAQADAAKQQSAQSALDFQRQYDLTQSQNAQQIAAANNYAKQGISAT